MDNHYKGRLSEKELNKSMKELLLKEDDERYYPAIEATIESSENPELEANINKEKEQEVIQKLRERTGIKGIGLAGTQMLMLVLAGLNIF